MFYHEFKFLASTSPHLPLEQCNFRNGKTQKCVLRHQFFFQNRIFKNSKQNGVDFPIFTTLKLHRSQKRYHYSNSNPMICTVRRKTGGRIVSAHTTSPLLEHLRSCVDFNSSGSFQVGISCIFNFLHDTHPFSSTYVWIDISQKHYIQPVARIRFFAQQQLCPQIRY